jgi:uncharacterized protein (TIGR00251 family)
MATEPESYLRAIPGGVRLALSVQPRASRTAFGELLGDRRKLAITAPPVDGKANAAIVKFLAKFFGVAKSSVRIVQGETGKLKTIEILGIAAPDARERLGD